MSQISVKYVDHMGDDLRVVNSARISFGTSKTEVSTQDRKLIQYLAEHEHMSPFEHNVLSVEISAPLYIRSQIMRHRTFSYNEISRRYTDKNIEFYMPTELRAQSKDNRQASDGVLSQDVSDGYLVEREKLFKMALDLYESMIASGVCKEQARGVLPQDLLTNFVMTGNLRNWVHFVKLRQHPGAQLEVQLIAEQVKDILLEKFGYSAYYLLEEIT